MSGEKNDAAKQGMQKAVKLTAYYSGKGGSLSPGTIVTLEADEADRLVGLGAAVEHKEEAKVEEKA